MVLIRVCVTWNTRADSVLVAGFSLLGHLDLDLELNDEMLFEIAVPVAQQSHVHIPTETDHPPPAVPSRAIVLDASRPLFFPVSHSNAAQRSVLDPTNWRTWFYRTDTDEAIRTRWEESKGELTAGWKRRHREAVKSRRRRGGGGTGEAEGTVAY